MAATHNTATNLALMLSLSPADAPVTVTRRPGRPKSCADTEIPLPSPPPRARATDPHRSSGGLEMDRQLRAHRYMNYVSAAAVVAAMLAVSSPASAQQANNTAVERGRYLVRITGCHDCHSPKVQGMTPNLDLALSGRPASTQLPTETKTEVHASPDLTAWTGPWGYSIAANLTPDAATGLGTRYTEASF